ncbi:MAG: RNase P subunit p30 family protein [Promethearchaeota archaeon]
MYTIEPCILLPSNYNEDKIVDFIVLWIKRAISLGYHGFILDISAANDTDEILRQINKIPTNLRVGFTLATRQTITAKNVQDLKRRLNGIRKRIKTDFLSFKSDNTEALSFCAKDSRIDIIKIASWNQQEAFTEGVASIAGQNEKFIELPIKPLIFNRGALRSKIIRSFNKIIDICINKKARLLFSSDAKDLHELKNPWQLLITLNIVLDLNRQLGWEIIMKNPIRLVSRLNLGPISD